ncbi:hypothetical protein BDV96DRAFT_597725 [Lophiotrema nucula]|uniref:Uncharacterized protein n=1 Tax=Lophiotrema nucula TaxID=690887 RepID=A0A6A5ZGH8_9PLEO|nr:hypothetical protein BDV96DRAFT_597725 [Lophiotrema nucula]
MAYPSGHGREAVYSRSYAPTNNMPRYDYSSPQYLSGPRVLYPDPSHIVATLRRHYHLLLATPPLHPSNYRMIRDGGWDHKHDFMRSYRIPFTEGYDEANELLDRFREFDDQERYEYEQAVKDRERYYSDCRDRCGELDEAYEHRADYGRGRHR